MILWIFSRVCVAFASESIINFEGEPKEKIIDFLTDPKISSSKEKISALNFFMNDLDPEEILSMLVPKINNLQEFLGVLKNCDDYHKSEVFYSHSKYGPLTKFLQTVNDILTSDHAGEISSYLEDYMQETIDFPNFPHSNPRSRLRQIIGELEVWKYMFFELDAKINTVAIASLKANNEISNFSSNKNRKKTKGKEKKKAYLPKHKKKQHWLATPNS